MWKFIARHMKFIRFLNSNEYSQRIFWYLGRQLRCEPTKIGHIFTNKIWWTWIKLKMLLIRIVLLVLYSNAKTCTGWLSPFLALKIDFENWNYPTFNIPQSNCLTRYKNHLRKLIWIQKSIEFHLPHYEIRQLSTFDIDT